MIKKTLPSAGRLTAILILAMAGSLNPARSLETTGTAHPAEAQGITHVIRSLEAPETSDTVYRTVGRGQEINLNLLWYAINHGDIFWQVSEDG
jgi:hypothetical protein